MAGALVAPTKVFGFLTFLAALALTLVLALSRRECGCRVPLRLVHGLLILIPPMISLFLLWGPEIPDLRSLLGILFLLTSLYGLTSMIRPRSPAISLALSFILSSLFLTIMYGSGFPEPALALEVLSLISSAVGFIFLKGDLKNEFLEVSSYSLLLMPSSLLLLSELTMVFNFLPYFITYDPILHQYWARMLADNLQAYDKWYYVGYHSILAFIYEAGGSSPLELVRASWSINLIALFLVHKSFSKLKGREISFVTWTAFSGLSWIAWIRYGADITALEKVEEVTYRSLTWGFPQFLWGFPLILSIGLLSLLIYLHEELDHPEIPIYITLLFLFLLHIVEAVLFSVYVLLRAIGGKRVPLSIAVVPLTVIILHFAWRTSGVIILPSLVMLVSSLLASLTFRTGFRIQCSEKWTSLRPILISLYLSGIVVWIYRMDSLDIYRIQKLGQVPWIIYPVLFGVPGLLVLLSDMMEGRAFLVLALSSIIMGKLTTIYKLWVGDIPYWEYRFVLYAFLGVSAAVGYQISKMKFRRKVLAVILLSGILSTSLSAARWAQIADTAGNVLNPSDVRFMINSNVSEPLLLFSYNSVWVAAYGPPVRWVRSVPPWVARGPEVVMASLDPFKQVDVLATIYDEALLWGMNASRSYVRRYWRVIPSISHIRTSCIDLNSSTAVILPSDIYLRERALDSYLLIGDALPPHTTYLRNDPFAPKGIYLGSPTSLIEVNEPLPVDPKDVRWIYVRGPFLKGLRVMGDEGVAVTRFELDEGEFELKACPEENNGSIAVIFEYEGPRRYREAGIDLVRGTVFGTEDDGPVPRSQCYRIVLRVGPGGTSLVVNGREFPLDGGGGVMGLHTVGFFGNLTGWVRGVHRVEGPRRGDMVLSVVPGGDVDLSALLDSYYRKGQVDSELLIKMRSNIQRIVNTRQLGRCGLPVDIGSARDIKARGSVFIEGTAVWVEEGGKKKYLNRERSALNAHAVRMRGGLGFYVVVEVKGAELDGTPLPDGSLIMFRTPFLFRANGSIQIRDYHVLNQFSTDISSPELKSIRVKVLMGDGAYLFTLSLPASSPHSAYNELGDLLLALPVVTILLIGRALLRRRLAGRGKGPEVMSSDIR